MWIASSRSILIAERLGEELDRPRLHGPHRHRNVAMGSDEDDGNADVGGR
jgi:hypothetical protein